MRSTFTVTALAFSLVLLVFASGNAVAQEGWEQILNQRLPLYGPRNWIVVADSAYPYQSREGIETLIAHADQVTTLRKVLGQISSSVHVRAAIYTDSELSFLNDADAPGVSVFRLSLSRC